MADETRSEASEAAGPPSIESLSRKLNRTREQLKLAVEKIKALEAKEVINSDRLNSLEVQLSELLIRKGKGDGEGYESEESNDSIEGLLIGGDKNESIGVQLPGLNLSVTRKDANTLVDNVQVRTGNPPGANINQRDVHGTSQMNEVAAERQQTLDVFDDPEDDQHGIRAKVLDTSKVVHYRFEGKERDYLQWAAMMQSYLEGFNLWTYVSGERPRPPAPGDPEFQQYGVDSVNYSRWMHWKRKDADCKNILRSNVHREVLPLFTPCDSSADMWQVLKETYQMDNPQSLANLKTALDQCKMQKGQSLEVYIKNHEQLVNQHSAIGRPIGEVDRIVSFLAGLPDRFDTIKTLYMSTSGQTYRNMITGLRAYEASKFKSGDKSDKGGGQAFSAKESKPKATRSDNKTREPCKKCGFKSHATNDCKVDLSAITCLKCNKKGHTVALCKAKVVPEEASTPGRCRTTP